MKLTVEQLEMLDSIIQAVYSLDLEDPRQAVGSQECSWLLTARTYSHELGLEGITACVLDLLAAERAIRRSEPLKHNLFNAKDLHSIARANIMGELAQVVLDQDEETRLAFYENRHRRIERGF